MAKITTKISVSVNGENQEFSSFDKAIEYITDAANRKFITLGELAVGKSFKYGGVEWIKLNGDNSTDTCRCLAKDVLFNRAFNPDKDGKNTNDWSKSPLREYLNGEFIAHLKKNGADPSCIYAFERDLTTDDGMTDYGTCEDIISMLSCDEYRKYRKLIPNCGKWFWTITADSLVYSYFVRFVDSDGALNCGYAYEGGGGVRPLCNLDSDISVSDNE